MKGGTVFVKAVADFGLIVAFIYYLVLYAEQQEAAAMN